MVYWTLRGVAEAGNPPRVMRIRQLHPSADWEIIWNNLHTCWTTEAIRINWHRVIHDILPTNECQHKIHLVDSPHCSQCGEPDTVQHRTSECGEGTRIWNWTKCRIVWIPRTDPENIPQDWTTRRHFNYGHPSVTVRCYGYWPKWCGTEPKKIEQGTNKTTVSS